MNAFCSVDLNSLQSAALSVTESWAFLWIIERVTDVYFSLQCPDGTIVVKPGCGGCPGDPLIVAAFRQLFQDCSLRCRSSLFDSDHKFEMLAKLPFSPGHDAVDISRTLYADDLFIVHKLLPALPKKVRPPSRYTLLDTRMQIFNEHLDLALLQDNLKQPRGKL